jgi:hypothetical protein
LLSFEATTLADTIPASGAPISVGVTLRNSGGGLARNISARLACADPQVSLLQASVAFPDMGSESNGVSLSPFLVSLRADTPARHRLWFWLEVMANDGTYTNTTSLCLETRDATLAGTPLAWLRAYGITNDVDQADLLDPDQDHLPTWQEYVAGPDPLKALSVFQILELKCLGASNRLSFHGTTNSGLASPFSVERATNLAAATPWQQLTTNLLRSASGTNTWWDTAPADGVPAFYRVRAR